MNTLTTIPAALAREPQGQPAWLAVSIVLGILLALAAVVFGPLLVRYVTWGHVARRLGLVRAGFNPRKLTGRVRGFPVKVVWNRSSSGWSSATHQGSLNHGTSFRSSLYFRVKYPPLGLGLDVSLAEGHRASARTSEGEVDVDGLDVAHADSAAVRSFLTTQRRRALVRLMLAYPGLVVGDDALYLRSSGTDGSAPFVERVLLELVDFAEQVLASEPSTR